MRLFAIAVLTCAAFALAQNSATDTPAPKPPLPVAPAGAQPVKRLPASTAASTKAASSPAADAPVVTLEGICKAKTAQGACKTVITREEIDRYVRTNSPDTSEAVRGRLAVQYARNLTYSMLAEQQGAAKNPVLEKELEFQLKLLRIRFLSAAYLQSIQQQTTGVTGAEIQQYYDAHRSQYEQIRILRVSVPFLVPTENSRQLDRAAIKAEMDALRERAAAGEDLNQLQLEAYTALHIKATPPPVTAQTVRRNALQGDETKIFDLKEGEVSPVLDALAAFAFVKVEAKDATSMDSVRQEIEAALRRERMQNALSKLGKNIGAKFDLAYLDLASQPDLFDPTSIAQPATRTPIRRRSGSPARASQIQPKN